MKARRVASAVVVFATMLATTASVDAARLYRWKDRYGVNQYGDHPPAADEQTTGEVSISRYRNPPGALVRLRLENKAGYYHAWADNLLHGPVQVMLRFKRGAHVMSTPALPASAMLAARSSRAVAIVAADPALGDDFELVLDALPGDPAAKPQDYGYRLPFEDAGVRVDQGPGGGFSHGDPQNRYAVDFALADGTPIVAVREGVVMQVESDFDKAGLNREQYGGRANFIRIVHADGSMAVYAHLQPEGVQVRAGQRVRKGQRIGLSGNTGFSSAPHLHFVLQVNAGMRLQSIPFRMFGPLGELKFPK